MKAPITTIKAIHRGELGVDYGCFDHETKLPRALKTVRARYALTV